MHPDRIAELLQPFLSGAADACHSDRNRGEGIGNREACPFGKLRASSERSRREPAVLSTPQLHHISTYINILLRWNSRINLTAIRDPEEIVTRHFGESFFAARHLFPAPAHRFSSEKNSSASSACSALKGSESVADLGSGAGFPGLPIKLWAPNIALTLVEANHKKAIFLREVARALALTDVNVENARAETLTQNFDVVALRAVERFAEILPVARRLLAPSGRLALLISSSQQVGARSVLPNLAWDPIIPIPQSESRQLLIGHIP